MSFTKNDQGKPQFHLVPQKALRVVAQVMTDGAAKYEPENWRLCEDPRRYLDALMRHVNEYLTGTTFDLDSTRHVLAHAAASCLMALELDIDQLEQDIKDRIASCMTDFLSNQEQCRYCEGSGKILGRKHDA